MNTVLHIHAHVLWDFPSVISFAYTSWFALLNMSTWRESIPLSLPSSVPGRRDKDGIVITVIRVLIAGWLSQTLAARSGRLAPPALRAQLLWSSSLELFRRSAGTSRVFSWQALCWCCRWHAILRADRGLFLATVCSLAPIGCGLTLWGRDWTWLWEGKVKLTSKTT